jgi:hypothetical protein
MPPSKIRFRMTRSAINLDFGADVSGVIVDVEEARSWPLIRRLPGRST